MEEIWKDVKGYEGLYQVSNLGKVRSLTRKVLTGKGYRITEGKILKPLINNTGYYRVNLKEHSKSHFKLIHRLVAEAFISNMNIYPYINHKDENPLNNRVDNLEWCTAKYNNNYGTHIKKIVEKKQKKVNQYDLKGNFIKEWQSATEIQKQLKYKQSSICGCCNNKKKTAYGYKWKYAEE